MKIQRIVHQRFLSSPPLPLCESRYWCYFLFHGAAHIDGHWGALSFENGFLALLRPGQSIFVTPDDESSYDLLVFSPENDECRLLDELPLPISPTVPPNIPELSNRIRVIEDVYYSSNKYSREINNADFLLLLYGTASGDEDIPTGTERSARTARMRRLRVLIYDDPLRFRTVEDGANYMHLSSAYFCNLYKKQFGTTFVQDCIRSRIKRCRMLLSTTDLAVKEIAKKLGYENEAFFYYQFKQVVGVTPEEYRRNPPRAV